MKRCNATRWRFRPMESLSTKERSEMCYDIMEKWNDVFATPEEQQTLYTALMNAIQWAVGDQSLKNEENKEQSTTINTATSEQMKIKEVMEIRKSNGLSTQSIRKLHTYRCNTIATTEP